MRLVCPNCGAQYEVDERVIPDSGRDVQCSSCGHAWYQMPAHMEAADGASAEPEGVVGVDDEGAEFEAEPESEAEDQAPEVAEPPAAPSPEVEEMTSAAAVPQDAAPAPAPAEAVPVSAPETVAEDEDIAPEDEDAALPAGGPPRRELDENLRAILQEEVAREMAARAADSEPRRAEPEPEPGPTEAQADEAAAAAEFDDDELPDIGPAPERDGSVGVFAAPPGEIGGRDKAPRRDLFPDIEEINSTLDSHGLAEDIDDDEDTEGRGGFGRGFFAIIFVAALALALYLVAPRLAETIPVLEPVLTGYVDAVNGARDWLDRLLQGLTSRMDSADQP